MNPVLPMLAFYGFITIIVFLVLIITRRLSVITAPVLVPVVIAFIAGFGYKEIGTMTLAGIKQVAPTGVLLMFAVLFFSAMPADITQHQLFFRYQQQFGRRNSIRLSSYE